MTSVNEAGSRHSLVTGGAGFVGSHLAAALLARGNRVTILDNLATGRRANIEPMLGDPSFRFVRGSVLDVDIVEELTSSCDRVFHLAAAVGVKLVVEKPLESFFTNTRGTEIAVAAAEKFGRKILIASTSEIYGKNSSGVLSEESDRVLGPASVARWSYAVSKAADEVIAHFYFKERGVATIIARLFNVAGPRQSPDFGMVIPRFIGQALSGAPMTVFGDGTQTRCFCHVADTVAGLISLMDEPDAVGGTYNVGSTDEISIMHLAERIIDATHSRSTIELIPFSQAYGIGFEDIERRVPDTTRIRVVTGWSATRDLDDIIGDVVAAEANVIS